MTQATHIVRTVTMKGRPLELAGIGVNVGQLAPDFIAVDNDLKEVHFADMQAKVFVLSSVPSLDTPICSIETHRFNAEADKLGPDVKVLTISMDLPFAQKRWCAAGGIQNLQTLSDYRYGAFGSAYGLMIKNLRLEARCVLVVGPGRKITYIQLVPELSTEPDYDKVLDAVQTALNK
jgi:thiol peroxidase